MNWEKTKNPQSKKDIKIFITWMFILSKVWTIPVCCTIVYHQTIPLIVVYDNDPGCT